MNYDGYEPCNCIANLTYQERDDELPRIINGRVEVEPSIKRLIIYSELKDIRVGFNNISTYVRRGATYICLCGIRDLPFESRINLTTDFLSVISRIPCSAPSTAAFYITGRNHHASCEDRKVPTLKDMAFLSLYLHGYANLDFEEFDRKGLLPKKLIYQRPCAYGQVIYCLPNHLVHIFPPTPSVYIPSCDQPHTHLFTHID